MTYSVDQVAEILHCDRKIVDRLVVLGHIPAVRFGAEWSIPTQTFLAYLNALASVQTRERQKQSTASSVGQKYSQKAFNSTSLQKIIPGKAGNELISADELAQLSNIGYLEPEFSTEAHLHSPATTRG